MALLVDGDACPDLPAIKDLAWKYQVEMTVFVDYAHFIQDDYFRTILCEVGSDSVDLVLLKQVQANDLVITQDYGLASLVLSKGAKVLHISGKVIDDNNIEELLMSRYVSAKQRKSGRRTRGPAKRTDEVRNQFLKQLDIILIQA